MRFFGFFFFVSLILFPSSVRAQCNSYRSGSYYSYYSTPSVVTEYITKEVLAPYPIIVPAFSFQYSAPCANVAASPCTNVASVQQQQVPLQQNASVQQSNVTYGGQSVGTAAVAQGGTVSPGGSSSSSALSPLQVDQLKEIVRSILIESKISTSTRATDGASSSSSSSTPNDSVDNGPPAYKDSQSEQPQQPQQPQQLQQPQQPQQNRETQGYNSRGGRPGPQSKYAQAALNAFSRNCASCHTGSGSKGDMVMFTQQDVFNPDAPFGSMLKEIERQHMPPKSSQWQPTPEERNVMVAFLKGQ